jgi:hypothetical protein
LLRLLLVAMLLLPAAVAVGEETPLSYAGRRLVSVLEEFREAGLDIAYSTNVVGDDLYVAAEPDPGAPLQIVRQVLRPHGLIVRRDAGVYVIVRQQQEPDPAPEAEIPATASPEPALDNVIVASSRYAISRDLSASRFSLDRRTIQSMPDVGEDPIRVTQRLPGAAASGASARAHFRGGEANEIGIMLNGNWLFDPFHIRDYQSVFSAIDARAIDGVEVYTGGFPVRYGDRMSGLVLMESLEPAGASHNEIGLSVFNTSLLTAGSSGDASWLFSARRGNLDLVINPDFGQPSYFDLFGEVAWTLSPAARISVNALYADDTVRLVLETDPEEREQIASNTRNAQVWLQLRSDWSPTLASNTVLSYVDYSNRRFGDAGDAEKMVASVRDFRDTRQVGLRQDWIWSPADDHRMQWGLHVVYGKADFSYEGQAEYFGLQAAIVDRPDAVDRSLAANPDGASYAVYIADRWQLSARTLFEWGLRWDDQTYTGLGSGLAECRAAYQRRPLSPVTGDPVAADRRRRNALLAGTARGSPDRRNALPVGRGRAPAAGGVHQGDEQGTAALRKPVRPARHHAGTAVRSRAPRTGGRQVTRRRDFGGPGPRRMELVGVVHVVEGH